MSRTSSLFSQILSLIKRSDFEKLVKLHGSDRGSKGFGSWDQFVSMLFCQLAQAKSLREICGGLACCLGKLRHLAMAKAPSNSMIEEAMLQARNMSSKKVGSGMIRTTSVARNVTESQSSLR